MTIRKRYSIEFQADAVKMILQKGLSIAEVSRILGVDYSVLWRWKKKYSKLIDHNNTPVSNNVAQNQEISNLNAQLSRVLEERDILMKALSHFITQLN